MNRINSLPLLLASLLPLGVLAPACSSSESTKGQLIECTTDPGTGVILRCAPGDGAGGGGDTCTDVDEDGDGEPTDGGGGGGDGPIIGLTGPAPSDGDDGDSSGSGDEDQDGVPDDDDCDHHPGEDLDDDDGDVDLPYDIKLEVGQTTTPIADAFAEKGAQPAAILSVTGATWRIDELRAGTSFTVTQADCDHAGNRDVGRDRVIVAWRNADGSTDADHLDLRYCED